MIQATDILRKQKFIHSTPGFKSKGFAQKGLPKYMVAAAKEARERMQQEILDPFVKIRHHVGIPSRGSHTWNFSLTD